MLEGHGLNKVNKKQKLVDIRFINYKTSKLFRC